MSNLERTLSIIKPDAVERNLENEIKETFKKETWEGTFKRTFKRNFQNRNVKTNLKRNKELWKGHLNELSNMKFKWAFTNNFKRKFQKET